MLALRSSATAWSTCTRYWSRQLSSEGILWHEEFKSERQAAADHTAVILHGLLGQGRNWRSFGKTLAQDAQRKTGSPWRVFNLDLRCHGNSSRLPGFYPPHTMQQCARDVVRFVDRHLGGVKPSLVIGHSMGGKVALEYVRMLAGSGTERACPVWVLDSQPGLVAADQVPDVQRVLEAVEKVPLPVTNRRQFTMNLKEQGFSDALVQWMASNLVPDPGHGTSDPRSTGENPLMWAFDVHGAISLYSSYRWTSGMVQKLRECEMQATTTHSQGESGQTISHVLEQAGHWVHMDQPKLLRSMIIQDL